MLQVVVTVAVAVVRARPFVRERRDEVVAPVEREFVLGRADGDALRRPGRHRDAGRVAVVAGRDHDHETRVDRRVHDRLGRIGAVRRAADAAERHARDLDSAIGGVGACEPGPHAMAVGDAPVEPHRVAAVRRSGVCEHLAVDEPRPGGHAGEEAGLAPGAEGGACDMGRVVLGRLRAVVGGIDAAVQGRAELGDAGGEVAAAEVLPAQTLVPRIARVHHVRAVIDAGVEDRDHDALAIEPQLLPGAREQHVVLRRADASGIAGTHNSRAVVVERVHDLDRRDPRHAGLRDDELDLGVGGLRHEIVDRVEGVEHAGAGRAQPLGVQRRRVVVVADVDAIGDRRPRAHADHRPFARVAVLVSCVDAVGVYALDAIVDAVVILVVEPCSRGRGRCDRAKNRGACQGDASSRAERSSFLHGILHSGGRTRLRREAGSSPRTIKDRGGA